MGRSYILSLIFYPQKNGGYTVICPELHGAITEGDTIDEAAENIRNIIADFLPERVSASPEDEETMRDGLCMRGKMFQELEITVEDGEVVFPPLGTKVERVAI
ncbi:MAG: type II toxin-antitoxin system HicB family antitoxin [Synergistaceae bacterium]|jgi:predicted RNase H-like HicB family nuclease|nr:type II toxin-antitoxin system HicB family antitoxin [Synergistaceae bacterium]